MSYQFHDPEIGKLAELARKLGARMEAGTGTVEPTLLDKLREQRDKELAELATAAEAREKDRGTFEGERTAFEARRATANDDERSAFDARVASFTAAEDQYAADVERREGSIRSLKRRIKDQRAIAESQRAAAKAARRLPAGEGVVRSEPQTYSQENRFETSYFADLACAFNAQAAGAMRHRSPEEALARLQRHAQEMDVELPKRAEQREREARKAIERSEKRASGGELLVDPFHRGHVVSPFEQRTPPSRVQGQGGYFVPPLWWSDFIAGLRPGRVTAGLCNSMPMPQGTDSINIPKLATLTTVAIQGADNQPVSQTDWTDTAVTANVKTLAGQSDIAIQILDMSPYPVDQMILSDLIADYNKKLDLQVLAGNGSNPTPLNGGQVVGLYSSAGASNWTSANTVTYTDGSPSAYKLFSVFGAMASNIAENRFLFDSTFAVVAHPRRAWWLASAVDGNNRPLVEPTNFGPFNVAAIEPSSVPAQGLVMQLPWGPPLYADANVTTADTAGGGSNQDIALGFLGSDAWLFESDMRTRVLPELLSGTLQIRFQVYAYLAFLLRYGQALAIASGSGFAAPTGAVSSITY